MPQAKADKHMINAHKKIYTSSGPKFWHTGKYEKNKVTQQIRHQNISILIYTKITKFSLA
jgi:hypothetical protein